MPGGIGSIDRELAKGLRCNDRVTGLGIAASHVEIFFNLGMDRVHYVPQQQLLYFPHSRYYPVLEIIEAVYKGLQIKLETEQLFVDEHGYYKGALRIVMPETLANAVLVALRLNSIKISVACE